ncbi:MAG: transketolase [candidate division Zixibacteria bacterium RBG_16_40_9]|nr:MAG: transketolase [candidate division Zixibacteria bacterium RBG_16_40_9]
MEQLKEVALRIRRDILTMLPEAGSGHTGGPLSACDFGTALFFNEMVYDPKNPKWPDRDMWFFSFGHVTPVHYSLLAEAGFFPKRDLLKFRKLDGHLQGHPSSLDTPGVEVSSGSLGQGLSIAVGAALGSRLDKHLRRIYCLMSDGEQQEGSIWEAAMSAAHYKLDNLCGLIDYNNIQIDGKVADVMEIAPLAEKYRAFGWHAIDIDGHNYRQILNALAEAKTVKGKPTAILCRTFMGKGVSFMEDDYHWHGKPPKKEEAEKALIELGTTYQEWYQYLLDH